MGSSTFAVERKFLHKRVEAFAYAVAQGLREDEFYELDEIEVLLGHTAHPEIQAQCIAAIRTHAPFALSTILARTDVNSAETHAAG